MGGVLRAFALILALALPALAPVWLASPAPAQEAAEAVQPDYGAWEDVADRAEAALADGRASTAAFEELRATLVEWRARFQAAQDINAARIATLKAQIEALGPAPAEGESEPAEIAARRAELNALLAELQAPRLRAIEAFKRADGLITEIDTLLRERQTRRLLQLGPSPVWPVHWPAAVTALTGTLTGVYDEIAVAWRSAAQRQDLTRNAPVLLGLLLITYLLLARLPRWLAAGWRMTPWGRKLSGRGPEAWAGFGRVLLAIAAGFTLTTALRLTGLLGFRGQILADTLPLAVTAWFLGNWLGRFVLVDGGPGPATARAGRLMGGLGLVWVADELLADWAALEDYTAEASAVLHFPLILVGALMLFRLAQLMGRIRGQGGDADPAAQVPMRHRVQRVISRLMKLAAILSLLAAAVGYGAAALSILFPAILTVGILAAVLALMQLVRAAYGVLTGKSDEEVAASLTPILFDFLLYAAALPVLALTWGARPEFLAELWVRFKAGLQIGETRISPADFLTFAIVFVVGYSLTRALQAALRNSVLPKTRLDKGGQTAIVSGLGYVGIIISALAAISAAGLNLSSLAIVAGALSVGIGFGLQNIVSNFVSGIILLIERPIAEGDWIEVGGQMGYVRDISVRSTRIETFDKTDLIVPNADLVSGTVTNYTHGNLIGRVIVPVSVAYGTDTRKVEKILREIAEAHPMVTLNPPPNVVFQNFGADGLEFEIRAILRDVNWILSVKSDMNHEIARRFAEEGIEIPFPQRDLWLRNPEALARAARAAEGGE